MGERTRRGNALRPSWNGAIRIEGRDEFLSHFPRIASPISARD